MSAERSTVLWCNERAGHDGKPYLNGFYSSRLSAAFHVEGAKDKPPILRATVRDLRDCEASRYWAWWDNERAAFMFVFVSPMLVSMCFPYGAEAAEKAGRGKVVNVMVEVHGPESEAT